MSFSNSSNFVIAQATFVGSQTSINYGIDALQCLSQYVGHGAAHDSCDQYDAQKCHPDTRKQLLKDVIEWLQEPAKETGMLYLHGPAGAGKSCVARSVCERASAAGLIVASFFFSRGSDDRNNTTKLFTTIAYQLAMLNNELAGYISAVIQKDPRIVHDAPAGRQLRKLILEPCRCFLRRSDEQLKGAIVIDGLDECADKEAQVSVIHLLAKIVRQRGFPLAIFVTSRPEFHLREMWATEDLTSAARFISLSSIPDTSEDIRIVLQSGFLRILNKCRYKVALQNVSRPWPSSKSVETLVERSSGQFIYAATVLKFISSPNRNPDAQLQIVLGVRKSHNSSPLADLDLLYYEILSRTEDPARTINVLAYLVSIMEVHQGKNIGAGTDSTDLSRPFRKVINGNQNILFLVVEQLLSLPRGEAYFALNDLHSLIDLNTGSEPYSNHCQVKFYHKSFHDFLLAKDRSKEFYIDIRATHEDITQSCLNFLRLPNYDTKEQHVGWLYSFFLWHFHIYESGRVNEIHRFRQPVDRFMPAAEQCLSPLLLKEAFNILELTHNTSDMYAVAEHLVSCRPLNATILAMINWLLWKLEDDVVKLSRFKDYVYFPLLFAHLQSYERDRFVKQTLAILAIVPFSRIINTGLYSSGAIHNFKSNYNMREDFNHLFSRYHPDDPNDNLIRFLTNVRYSGIFNCTSNDFADAYISIINISVPVFEMTMERQYATMLNQWTSTLQYINPAATPAFLAVLKSTARDVHDQPGLNRSLTHSAEVWLLSWLKSLPTPPKDIINSWRKAFEKARCATRENSDGYTRYLCGSHWFDTKCPNSTCS